MRLALKEWPAAIDALGSGKTILLFRKGGIRETTPSFNLPSRQALLFPSFEHQKLSMLKCGNVYENQLSPYHPGEKVALHNWVEFKGVFEMRVEQLLPELSGFHIWTDEFLQQRLSWKPERPLFALACMTHRFNHPIHLPYQPQYGGCKSWIELDTDLVLPGSTPVITDKNFSRTLARIRHIIG